MAVAPQTELYLLKCPLTLSNKNQITFANQEDQEEYFLSLPKLEIERISYQRKNGIISYPAHIDSILEYNYCMYKNNNYSDKWFYAYITDMIYENDNCTYIKIVTDVFQTWQFDIIFKESFVEREMINVNDDIPGNNLVPEGLETGEYKIGGSAEINGLNPIYVVAYSRNPKDDGLTTQTPSAQGIILNGIPSGMFYCVCSKNTIQGLLNTINTAGYGESIVAVFSVPAICFIGFNGWTLNDLISGESILYWIVNDFKANPQTSTMISLPSSIDGYTPKNKKVLTYPYIYLGFNPLNGTEKIFRYENFSNNTPIFKMISEVNPNPTICFIPQNYRGKTGDNLSDIATLNGYPQISWITDFFNSWIAQNSDIIKLQMQQESFNYQIDTYKQGLSLAGSIGGTAVAGAGNDAFGVVKGMTNVISDAFELARLDKNHEFYVKNQMAQVEKQQMLPNTSHLGTSATILGYDLINDNVFTRYNIKSQFAERIDKYFDMYGYLTNIRKIPNLNNRPNWNYIKTNGANILGNIPQTDLYEIKEFFDNGITLWHNPANFLNYSVNNR